MGPGEKCAEQVKAQLLAQIAPAVTSAAREAMSDLLTIWPRGSGESASAWRTLPAAAPNPESTAAIVNDVEYASFVKTDNGSTAIEYLDSQRDQICRDIERGLRDV